VELRGENVVCYLSKIESVGLKKCPLHIIINLLTNRIQQTFLRVFYPHDGGENQLERNYVIVTLCIAQNVTGQQSATNAFKIVIIFKSNQTL